MLNLNSFPAKDKSVSLLLSHFSLIFSLTLSLTIHPLLFLRFFSMHFRLCSGNCLPEVGYKREDRIEKLAWLSENSYCIMNFYFRFQRKLLARKLFQIVLSICFANDSGYRFTGPYGFMAEKVIEKMCERTRFFARRQCCHL